MKKLALTVAVAAATSGSVEAQAFNGFMNFEALQQTIECVRKPGTDYLTCTNKTVDSEEETTTEPEVESTPEPTGRYYFSEASELIISQEYWPEVHDKEPGVYDHMGPPPTMLGEWGVADFDQNGLDDIVMQVKWKKGRHLTDPEKCGGTTPLGLQGTCFTNLDHEEEQWNESWDSVVVLLQKDTGVWEVGNRELFGYDRPQLGHGSRKTNLADFNQDGYPDFMWSGGREDGRAPERIDPDDRWSPTNMASASQKVMISNGDGTYRIEDLNLRVYGHAGTVAKMQNGQTDVIYPSGRPSNRYWWEPDLTFTYQGVDGIRLGAGLIPAQVRTWYNGVQEPVENYIHLNAGDFRASKPEEINGEVYSRYLIDTSSHVDWTFQTLEWCLNNRVKCDGKVGSEGYEVNGGNPGISYHPRNYKSSGGEGLKHGFILYEQIDSEWVKLDTYVWGTEGGYIKFYDSSDRSQVGDERAINEWPVIDLGDSWGVAMNTPDSCSIKMYPDSDPIFIFELGGQVVSKDVPEPVDVNIDAYNVATYMAVGMVDGELTEIDIWPEGNEHTGAARFRCEDINGDGYDDLFAKSSAFWEHKPAEFVVWLNDQNGGLVRTEIQVDNPETDFTGGIDINAEAKLGEASEYYGEGFGDQMLLDVNGDGIGDLVGYEQQFARFTVRYGINPQEIQ